MYRSQQLSFLTPTFSNLISPRTIQLTALRSVHHHRTFDTVSPLMHEYTYQAMVMDLLEVMPSLSLFCWSISSVALSLSPSLLLLSLLCLYFIFQFYLPGLSCVAETISFATFAVIGSSSCSVFYTSLTFLPYHHCFVSR
jgi:hypothetical protein